MLFAGEPDARAYRGRTPTLDLQQRVELLEGLGRLKADRFGGRAELGDVIVLGPFDRPPMRILAGNAGLRTFVIDRVISEAEKIMTRRRYLTHAFVRLALRSSSFAKCGGKYGKLQ